METLQAKENAIQIYQGNHFGRNGEVAKAKGCYVQAHFDHKLGATGTQYKVQPNYVRQKLMEYISALSGALVPAIKSGRLIAAYKYLTELRTMVSVLSKDYGFKNLGPTELEVLLAVFIKAWIFPPLWVRKGIVKLGDKILDSGATYSTVALTNARLSTAKVLSKKMREQYREAAKEVVLRACESGLDHGLQWETVARVASMVRLPVQMHFAAYMDGRPDVVNKYGYSLINVFVHKLRKLKQ
jgi:hypothetical protein